MSRPQRSRRVCAEPAHRIFKPVGMTDAKSEILTVDEYETIRLIDYLNMTQAQCAEQMNISRTNVTEIYERARFKIADCIVNGKQFSISGGNYNVCNGEASSSCSCILKK